MSIVRLFLVDRLSFFYLSKKLNFLRFSHIFLCFLLNILLYRRIEQLFDWKSIFHHSFIKYLSLISFENHLFVSFKELHLSVSTNSSVVWFLVICQSLFVLVIDRSLSLFSTSQAFIVLIVYCFYFILIFSKNILRINIVNFAYQVHDYLLIIKFDLLKKASKDVHILMKCLVYHHRRTASIVITSRFTKRAKSVEKTTFSDDWIVNKTNLLKDLKKLHEHSKNYRQSIEYTIFKKQIDDETLSSEASFWDNISFSWEALKRHNSSNDRFITVKLSKHSESSSDSNSVDMTFGDNDLKNSIEFANDSSSTDIDRNQRHAEAQQEWNEVSQEEWNSLQGIIQSMNAINKTLQATLEVIQISILIDQRQTSIISIQQSISIHQNSSQNFRWNAADIDFFDSLYDGKSAFIDNAIEHSEKDIYFRNVHVFIERIKDMSQIKSEAIVRNNLYTCLRETALTWYTSNLEKNQKRLVKLDDEVEKWIRILLKKFRQSSETAFVTVIREKFIIDDVRRRRKSVEYAQIIIRVAKSVEMSTYNQMYLIYNDLNIEFRRNISISNENINLNEFLQELNRKKEIWWAIDYRNRENLQHQRQEYSQIISNYSRNYENQYYDNQLTNNYSRQRSMKNTNDNRSYFSRYSNQNQDQYLNAQSFNTRYAEDFVSKFERQIQYNSNNSNQKFMRRSFVQDSVPQFVRTFYLYDKEKQNTSHLRFSYLNDKTQVSWQSQNQAFYDQKAYYAENEKYYQKHSMNFSIEYENQKNVFIAREQEECDNTIFMSNTTSVKKEFEEISQNFFVDCSIFMNISHKCRQCEVSCLSNNKLHKHLKMCRKQHTQIAMIECQDSSKVILSNVKIINSINYIEVDLRRWHYFMIKIIIALNILDFFCLNTNCDMFMIDRNYLCKMISKYKSKIRITDSSTKVRNIEASVIVFSEFIILNMNISKFLHERLITERITENFHIVEDLSVKILIEMNIIGLERMKIDFRNLMIESCENMSVELSAINSDDLKVKRVVMSTKNMIIFSHINQFVPATIKEKFKKLSDRNYAFHSTQNNRFDFDDDILFHIVNANFFCIHVRNITNNSVVIFRRNRLKTLQKYENDDCYLIFSKNAHLTVDKRSTRNTKLTVRILIENHKKKKSEITLFNEITIYENAQTTLLLKKVAQKYIKLWKDDERIINVSVNKWMSIKLKLKTKVSAVRVYSLESKDKKIVDRKFDKLHLQDRMQYFAESIFHEYSVFVIWRTMLKPDMKLIKKDRVVVNIRALNKITKTDTYSMSLQTDIISSIAECFYIFTMNAFAFFHQWLVKLEDRHKLIVIIHRGQKQFNVEVMSFKNISSYVQREIDNILRNYKKFCRVYIDDIVIFSKILKKHFKHLDTIFNLFDRLHINLSSFKSFLSYSSVQLLKLRIDAFNLSTSIEKLKAIAKLQFSTTLRDLKMYFEFTEWLRKHISYYAQKFEFLQKKKTMLLKLSSSNKERQRKIYFDRTFLMNFNIAKLKAYNQIQKFFAKFTFLVHFDCIRRLYADIDAFKQRDFETMIYHDKSDRKYSSKTDDPRVSDIQSILFLSRLLSETEKKYWSTELKMTDLIWMIKRIRHMIDAAKNTIIMFTDHATNSFIVDQIIRNSDNTNKLNLRLVRAFTYFSQFNLEVRYKIDKFNVVPDALSRLSITNDSKNTDNLNALNFNTYHAKIENISMSNAMHAFQGTLISMISEFRRKIIEDYFKDKPWEKILEMLKNLQTRMTLEKDNITNEINFEFHNDLIYHKKRRKLCISSNLEKYVFELAHDKNQHSEAHRCFQRINDTLFIFRLSRKIRVYIDHCSKCQLNQTKRHKSYEELMSIVSSSISFHTIAMNFVLAILENLDILLTITCKFSKRLTIIQEKFTYIAIQWNQLMIDRLLIADWGISLAIISDKDSKFMSDFWQAFFKRLNVSLLISIVYHSQTNEQFERSNQTVEIAVRFLTASELNISAVLSSIQAQFNNSSNATTDLTLNQIVYEFKIREAISFINDQTFEEFFIESTRLKYRTKVAEAISYANAQMKIRYDSRHVSLLFKSEDKAYLKLHKNYKISSQENRKLFNQRCELFLVKRRIEKLSYELDLSSTWRIHSVISVVQLKPAVFTEDSYNRSRSNHSDSVQIEENIETEKSYEIERIVVKRIRKYERTKVTQYCIQWKKYEPEYNEWKSISALSNCMKLIEKFESAKRNRNVSS